MPFRSFDLSPPAPLEFLFQPFKNLMDSNTTRIAQKFQKLIHLRKSPKDASFSNPRFRPSSIPQEKLRKKPGEEEAMEELRSRAAMEAFVAKLFATVSAVKASYAEMQIAQFPYDSEAVQSADQSIVQELKSLSGLKELHFEKQSIESSSPYLRLLLAEIQEQQSLMKTYEVCMKKFQSEIESKEAQIASLQRQLKEIVGNNKSLEGKINSSRSFSVLSNVNKLSDLKPKDFILVLNYALRSVRNFVKLLIREMESAHWDIQSAAGATQPDVVLNNEEDKAFVFESFVCREMFTEFDRPNYSIQNEEKSRGRSSFFEEWKKLRSETNPFDFLKKNPNSLFGKLLKSKYLKLIHPKMELSFFGSLNQRKMVNSGEFPETEFFKAFAEMGKRVWLLHCLAFSLDDQVSIFQVKQNSRFSELYMESVTDGIFSGETTRVPFTVVPGFMIGGVVVQSRVYLSSY